MSIAQEPDTAQPCDRCLPIPPPLTDPQWVPGHGHTDCWLEGTRAVPNPQAVPGLEEFPPHLARLHIRLAIRHLKTLDQTELAERCYSPNLTTAWLARQGMAARGWQIPLPTPRPYQHRSAVVSAQERARPEPALDVESARAKLRRDR